MDEMPQQTPTPEAPTPDTPWHKHRVTWPVTVGILAAVVIGISLFVVFHKSSSSTSSQTTPTPTASTESTTQAAASNVQGLVLDANKNYGDKYANGILPVGDDQYSTSAATKGKVYLCNANFVPDGQAGAQTRGPWFIGTTQWDINKKTYVHGSVSWQPNISNKLSGSTRVITTNDLPDHITGIFPVQTSDAAYSYDHNPNTIKSQSLTYNLSANPTYGTPSCMGGEVGVMLTGVAIFNGFDAGGRDAGAWEVQDSCEGHPQSSGIYHYHTLSSCIKDVSERTVIGFALDGFPITGPKIGDGNYLTTSDLDECHGITSDIVLDGKKTTTYHYVMTQDFPYSVSCFRATAIQAPGQHASGAGPRP